MAANRPGLVFIDPEGPEGSLGLHGGPGVIATWEVEYDGPKYVEAGFRTFEDAIAWGRQRSPLILVRLGPTEDTYYSAGEKVVTRDVPEYAGADLTPYTEWPPPTWTPRNWTINPPLYEIERDFSQPRPVDPLQERFPELYEFFAGYFHEDWSLDAADDMGIVRLFKADAPPEQVLRTRHQLEILLGLPLSEEETSTAIWDSFGCCYDPAFRDLSMRNWLRLIHAELARS